MPSFLLLRMEFVFQNKDFVVGKNGLRFFTWNAVLVAVLKSISRIPVEADDL